MYNNANSGYKGYSMSVRASEAYEDGEKPLSKWTKAEIVCDIEYYFEDKELTPNFTYEKLAKLTLEEMKLHLLEYSSYHHTSAMFNPTNFYRLKEEYIEKLTDDDITVIISERPPRKKPEYSKSEPEEKPKYITAYVAYDKWIGTRTHPKKVVKKGICKYMSTDKLVRVNYENKRLSSLSIIVSLEGKHSYPTEEALVKEYKRQYLNETSTFAYIDKLGEISTKEIKARGRGKGKTIVDYKGTEITYNEQGNETYRKDIYGRNSRYKYAKDGRLKSEHYKHPDGTEERREYYANGEKKSEHSKYKNKKGEYERWREYHENGKRKSFHTKDPDGSEEIREYHPNGKRKSAYVRDNLGIEGWNEYDERGNETYRKTKDDKGEYERWYEHNKDGQCVHTKDSLGFETWTKYNPDGSVLEVRDSNGNKHQGKTRDTDEPSRVFYNQSASAKVKSNNQK